MDNKLYSKVGNATKWSAITEILSKIVTPISNMLLARILAPEAFGIVATITMITSFADVFTDAGFQKYIIQHQFKDEKEKEQNITVAFWTNLSISCLIWLLIVIFVQPLSAMVGTSGNEVSVIVASFVLILTAFSSIQIAIYKSIFDFKTLFIVKCILIIVPFVVTIPVALITKSFWSLIVGNLVLNFTNAVVLTIKSPWKPRFFYNIRILKEMLSFSIWSLIDNVLNWLTTWGDTFIIGITLTAYYVGLYKTTMNTVNSIMAIITGATTSVLLTALSKLQNDKNEFDKMLFKFQHLTSMLLVPLGTGVFLYRKLVTTILLGSQWMEAENFVGMWGLMSAIAVLFNTYGSCVCIAKGRPKLSALAQVLQLTVLFPVVYFTSGLGFPVLYTARTLIRIEGIIVYVVIMKFCFKISILEMFYQIAVPLFASIVMAGVSIVLQMISDSFIWSCISVLICMMAYFLTMMIFPKERKEIMGYTSKFKKKITFRGKENCQNKKKN